MSGQKIIEGLEEALKHAKGEAPARYNCRHWHQSYEEAMRCPDLQKILKGGKHDSRSDPGVAEGAGS